MNQSLPRFFVVISFLGVVALFCDKSQFSGIVCLDGAIKARLIPDVALAGINTDLQNNTVLVAVNEYLLDLLDVAGLFPFLPQLLARPAVICCKARFDGLFKRLFIHIGNHQDFIGLCILGYCSEQAVGVEPRCEIFTFFDCLFVRRQLFVSVYKP